MSLADWICVDDVQEPEREIQAHAYRSGLYELRTGAPGQWIQAGNPVEVVA